MGARRWGVATPLSSGDGRPVAHRSDRDHRRFKAGDGITGITILRERREVGRPGIRGGPVRGQSGPPSWYRWSLDPARSEDDERICHRG